MPRKMLLALEGLVEPFLVKWAMHMDRAGYLRCTTAKREDCVLSYEDFLQPLWGELRAGQNPGDFVSLLGREDTWAEPLLATARRHRFRGVTAEMFLGCLKTLVHSVEELLREMEAPAERTMDAVAILRGYADAVDTLLVGDWTSLSQQEALVRLDASNRQLTLQKNKFENIFATTSDLVLLADAHGRVDEANREACRLLDESLFSRKAVWEILDLKGMNMAEILGLYPPGAAHEISLSGGTVFFEMHIAPLSSVSLASSSYLFLLTDITAHVRNREILEDRVRERTAELEEKTARLEEMNITLRNVLSSIESERKEFRRSVAHTVETTLLPALKSVQGANDPTVRQGYVGLLSDQLMRLYQDTAGGRDARMLSLTPMELKICQFIQSGSRTKDIAETFNLSMETVQTHRKNIRRKLRLKGKEVNLLTFLKTGS